MTVSTGHAAIHQGGEALIAVREFAMSIQGRCRQGEDRPKSPPGDNDDVGLDREQSGDGEVEPRLKPSEDSAETIHQSIAAYSTVSMVRTDPLSGREGVPGFDRVPGLGICGIQLDLLRSAAALEGG